MAKEKSEAEKLKEQLFLKRKNAGEELSEQELKKADMYCEGYKDFINTAKTEREAVKAAIELARAKGFREYNVGEKLKAGDKVFYNNRGKAILLAVMGSEPIENGVNIVASHIDSPRLDFKQNPLYENEDFGYFKTHYYGGIKKYQWTAIPLSLHGVIAKADGTEITVNIGEDEKDPVFCVTDLLPHLATEQMKRSANEVVKGEELNILIGSRPFKDDKASEKVKLNLMILLNEKYGITEDDFISAELEAVPAFKASDMGLDRSFIGGYGQDDRVCSYPALTAVLDTTAPKRTAVCVLSDKEEIGSDGNTGLNSSYMEYFIYNLAKPFGVEGYTVLSHSACLSADVNAGFDPSFPDVAEKNNFAFLNRGICLTKYMGARGKSGSSDASAEFISRIRNIFDSHEVIWQTGELGKVDAGGGGTVAMYIANLDVDVLDVGVPILSMHSPYEVAAKTDIYMAYKAYKSFMSAMCN